MERRGQDKELEMPTTLGYNSSSSSKLSTSPTTIGGERSDQPSQTHTATTLVFNDPPPPPQTQHHHHHHPLYPPPHLLVPSNNQLHQSQRTSTDPDLTSHHPNTIATTSITSTPRTPPITVATATAAAAATTTQTPTTTITDTTSTTTSSTSLIRYRECLRNHAASMGSHVVDGCGEFMPGGEEGTPESLKCAACDCHRNFHRKEVEGSSLQQQQQQHNHHHASSNYQSYYPNKHNGHSNIPSPHLQFHTPPSSSLHQQQHHRFSHGVAAAAITPSGGLVQPVMMAFGGAAESSSEDLNMFQSNTVGGQLSVQMPMSKKRFRTKFSQNQKDKMMEFAEKLGWKIQKHDEQEVQQFCSQVGVRRQVFKVWMHNNKQAMKKQQQ